MSIYIKIIEIFKSTHKIIMKKKNIKLCMVAVSAAFIVSGMPADSTMTSKGNTTIVNTTTIAKGVKGYKHNTPVKIYIERNRVVKVEALPNQETPKYFAKAKNLLKNYEGKTTRKAEKMSVDAVSGATMSSKALMKNVQVGLEYYRRNK